MEQAENSTIPTQDTMDSQPDENGNKEAKQTLAESLEILKSYDPKSHYAVDSYIDAQDSFSSWRVGKILEINNDFLKINFDGWSHKWDENIHKNSSKLHPFKMKTPPYTGGNKAAIRNFEFESSRGILIEMIKQLKYFSNQKFDGEDPYLITQFLRGELYVFMDSVMSVNTLIPDPSDVKLIHELFITYLDMFVEYLKQIRSLLRIYIEGRLLNQPMLYLVNPQIAVVSAFPELTDTVAKLFGGSLRVKVFDNASFQTQIVGDAIANRPKDNFGRNFTEIVNLINYFASIGGFDLLNQLLSWKEQSSNDKSAKTRDPEYKFPLNFIYWIFRLVSPASLHFTQNYKNQFYFDFKEAFFDRVTQLTPKDMKDNDLLSVFPLVRDSLPLFEGYFSKDAYAICEMAELECGLSILQCPYMEKRVKVLVEFKDFVERADPNANSGKLEKRKFYHINLDKLKKWLLEKDILNHIIGNQFHGEVLKRSIKIIKFLASQNALSTANVAKLWQFSEGAHEADVRAIYSVIIDITKDATPEVLDQLYSKIKEIPIEKYDDPVIQLIKDFSLNASEILNGHSNSANSYFQKFKKSNKGESYGLKLLWDAIQDTSNLDNQYSQTAFAALKVIAKNAHFKNDREKYLQVCFDNLKKGKSVPQSLIFSLHILSTYQNSSGFLGFGSGLDDIIGKYQKEYNLLDTTIKDFSRYIKIVDEKVKALGKIPENPSSYIFDGRHNHQQNINQRLIFIENLTVQLKKVEFTLDHLRKMWKYLVLDSVTEIERQIFLKWITRQKDQSKANSSYILELPLMKSFFLNVLCNVEQTNNYSVFTTEVFKCFQKCFEIINEHEKNIEYVRSNFKIKNFHKLVGYDHLWYILMRCVDDKVLVVIKRFIVDLHLRVTTTDTDAQVGVWKKFITQVMECLDMSQKKRVSVTVKTIVSMLNLFILSFDGRLYVKADGKVPKNITFSVVDKKDIRVKKHVEVPTNGTLFLLRKRISEQFNVPLKSFEMYLSNGYRIPIDAEEDNSISQIEHIKGKDPEKDMMISLDTIASNNQHLKDKFKASMINNQQVMDTLFELLASSDSSIINDTWDVLSNLPTNKNIKSTIKNLTISTEEEWFKILDPSCVRKLLYCLEVVQDLATNSGQQNIEEWSLTFIEKGGFSHLFKIYFQIKDENLSSSFNKRSLATLIRIINFFLETYGTMLGLTEKQLEDIIEKLLQGLVLVSKSPLTESQINNSKDDEITTHDLTFYSFQLLQTLLKLEPKLIKLVYSHSDLELLLKNGLIESQDEKFKGDFFNGFISLLELAAQLPFPEDIENPFKFFLKVMLRKTLPGVFEHRNQCKEFFKAIFIIYSKLITVENEEDAKEIDHTVDYLADTIIKLEPYERQNTDQDHLLQGLVGLLAIIIQKNSQVKEELFLKRKPELLHTLLHSCLFEIPNSAYIYTDIMPPRCKSPESRRIVYKLLMNLCLQPGELMEKIVDYLKGPLVKCFWRNPTQKDWFIVPFTSERSTTGFVGLHNQGATCYMNSLLQQFFMIPDFRESILTAEDFQEGAIPDPDNTLMQLKNVFGALKISQRMFYDPKMFCYSFKDYEGNPVNVRQQMDIDEFFTNLMDKIENAIRPSKQSQIIKRVFGGVQSNELIFKGCPHYSETEEPFLAIPLPVKNKKNVKESLQSYISGETLEGDNAVMCGKCEKKVPAIRRTCIKKLPNVLILVLKRFEFDLDTMQKVKVNDYCEFTEHIDMYPYTRKFLQQKKDNQKSENDDSDDSDEKNIIDTDPDYPPEYYSYNLRGVAIHQGTADAGHYYSLIKNNKDKWFEFNDTNVRPFKFEDLADEAFGGEEAWSQFGDNNSTKQLREKTNNAYLLFYERKTYFDEQGNKIPSMLVTGMDEKQLEEEKVHSQKIYDEIRDDNYKFQMIKVIFDKDYDDFIYQVVRSCAKSDFSNPSKELLNGSKFSIIFFLTVILRAQDRTRLPPCLVEIKTILQKSTDISTWFIESFINLEIIKEFLIDCAVEDMRYFVYGLLKLAMKTVYEPLKNIPYEEYEGTPIFELANALFYVLFTEKQKMSPLFHVYKSVAAYSSLGKNAHIHLLKRRMMARLIHFMNEEEQPSKINSLEVDFTFVPRQSELGMPTNQKDLKASQLLQIENGNIPEASVALNKSFNYNPLLEIIHNLFMAFVQLNATEVKLPKWKEDLYTEMERRKASNANQNLNLSVEPSTSEGKLESSSYLEATQKLQNGEQVQTGQNESVQPPKENDQQQDSNQEESNERQNPDGQEEEGGAMNGEQQQQQQAEELKPTPKEQNADKPQEDAEAKDQELQALNEGGENKKEESEPKENGEAVQENGDQDKENEGQKDEDEDQKDKDENQEEKPVQENGDQYQKDDAKDNQEEEPKKENELHEENGEKQVQEGEKKEEVENKDEEGEKKEDVEHKVEQGEKKEEVEPEKQNGEQEEKINQQNEKSNDKVEEGENKKEEEPAEGNGDQQKEDDKKDQEEAKKEDQKVNKEAEVAIVSETADLISGIISQLNLNRKYKKVELFCEEDKSLFFRNTQNIRNMLVNATTNRARQMVTDIICKIATKRQDFSYDVLKILKKELDESDSNALRVHFIALEKLMKIFDQHQSFRVETGMKLLKNVIKDNQRFYIATNVAIEYLFKICGRNELCMKDINEDIPFIRFLESWVRDNTHPDKGLNHQTLKLFKRRNYTVLNNVVMQYSHKFTNKLYERLNKIERMYHQQDHKIAPEYDPDEDYSQHQYQIGETVDFRNSNGEWVTGTVLENLDEMIKLKLPGDQTHWAHYDVDRTAPHLAMQNQTKYDVKFYRLN